MILLLCILFSYSLSAAVHSKCDQTGICCSDSKFVCFHVIIRQNSKSMFNFSSIISIVTSTLSIPAHTSADSASQVN